MDPFVCAFRGRRDSYQVPLALAEEGLLDLDDPLGRHLPDLAWMQDTPLRDRTLRELLTHTAGLPAWTPMYTWGDAATIRARFLQEPWAMTDPGAVRYSDLGYGLLGRVLERVRTCSLRDFPLDRKSTRLNSSH